MKLLSSSGFSAATVAAVCLMAGSVGCRKGEIPAAEAGGNRSATLAAELRENTLGALPGAVYRSQAGSAIHWQPWTQESMDRAKAANRLVFAVIAMPQQPGFQSVLASLADNPALVAAIHENYVPVLIDGDAAREVGILTADLCTEVKRGLQLPLFLWMTPDANPVAWIPVAKSATGSVADLFNQSHLMVSQTWQDDVKNNQSYVSNNSAMDNASRRKRIAQRKNSEVMSGQPAADSLRGLRQLASFYDPDSRTFDEVGGLFPSGSIDLLATAAMHPGVPADVRERCLETTRELLVDLLPSAMFDPLDGGLFASRRGKLWSFPGFFRDSVSQSRAAVALIHAYRATGNPRALERALGVIGFAEKAYGTSEGLISAGMADESEPAAWLWSVEEIERELSPEDAAWWIKATGMKGLGNLPFESDPRREFFRSNSLSLGKSMAELAAEQGQSLEEFTQRFETVRKQLLKVRNTRLGPVVRDDSSHAGATFRMVSAYAAAFGVTGDPQFREKAVSLLEKARTAFSDGPRLRLFSKDAPPSIGAGRAFLYGLALQSAVDVADITLDDQWLLWAEDLATTAAELFTDSEFLKECPDDAKIIDLPMTDLVMLFDDSTAGLVSFAECRLAERDRPLVATFSQLATPLPTYAVTRPTICTDLLQATIAREFKVTVIVGEGLSPAMKLAVERLPMRMIQRRAATSKDEIPSGSVKILLPESEPRVVSTPEALQQAVLPLAPKL